MTYSLSYKKKLCHKIENLTSKNTCYSILKLLIQKEYIENKQNVIY